MGTDITVFNILVKITITITNCYTGTIHSAILFSMTPVKI